MPKIQALEVKKLRQKTGAGIMDCKQALKASDNDFTKALAWLKKKGLSTVAKKSGRKAIEGLVASYIHWNGRIGVLLEVNSETDFVARNEEFKSFSKELSLHIAAMRPLYVKEGDIPEEERKREKKVFQERVLPDGEDKEKSRETFYQNWLSEVCLLKQNFVRENSADGQNVGQALNDLIARLGENIVIRRFVRFELGENVQKTPSNFSGELEKTKKGSGFV